MSECKQAGVAVKSGLWGCGSRVQRRKVFRNKWWNALPALSAPGTVGSDDHLSAVIRVSVVHVELEAFPFVRLYQREQVLRLHRRENAQRLGKHHKGVGGATAGTAACARYLVHDCVCTNDVVGVRPQAGERRWRIWLHFLWSTEWENEATEALRS